MELKCLSKGVRNNITVIFLIAGICHLYMVDDLNQYEISLTIYYQPHTHNC